MTDKRPPAPPGPPAPGGITNGGPRGRDEEDGQGSERDYIEEKYQPCFIRYITAIARTWGMLTVIVVWILTGLLLKDIKDHKYAPWYGLGLSILLTFFETIWIINKCAVKCRERNIGCHQCNQGGCCCMFWRFLVWIDNWRKTILYVCLAIPCFLQAIVSTETIISGLMLLVAAAFYFTKSFKESTCVSRTPRRDAYVQTASPSTKLVAHSAQYGQQEAPPDYHTYHTTPSRVQPESQSQIRRSPLPSTMSLDRPDWQEKDGRVPSRSKSLLDPQGRKKQRYADPADERVVPESADNIRGSRESVRSQEYRDRRRSPDRYERRSSRSPDRYDRRSSRSPDRYDRRSSRSPDRYDRRSSRSPDRYKDRYPDRDDRYRDRNRDRPRYEKIRDRSPEEDDRDRDYDRDRDHYRDRSPEEYRRSSHRRRHSGGSSRSPKQRFPSPDRCQSMSPSRKEKSTEESPPPAPPPPTPPPVKETPSKEPPPLKDLPAEASEAMHQSAAAKLIRQSSGSPVVPPGDTIRSRMPDKLEKKAATMKNPLNKPAGKNPFDEDIEDEYFD